MKFLFGVVMSLLISTPAALGHEFWIAPKSYQILKSENIVASLRSGQNFSGAPFSFLPQRFSRFDLVQRDVSITVEGRIGDRPALNMAAQGPGLWVVVHETTDSKITWNEWAKFADFVNHKLLGNALLDHVERGLPTVGFSERYRRFAKSLVAVGTGTGADHPVGLRTEIVALANPYTDDVSGGLPVLVLLEGLPRTNAQIEIFAKDETGKVTVSTVHTDQLGSAIIPVKAGVEYLLDAVVLLPLETTDPDTEPVWESLWAALTFRVPG